MALLASLALLSFLADPSRAELRINEVLSAPASDWNGDGSIDFKNDEWVEIINTGSAVENLDGVFLRDGTGDSYHYGFSGSLAPGAVLVVYGNEAVAWQAANGAGSSGLSLNNSGDSLELWRDLDTPRVLEALDVISIPAHAAAAERAMGRDAVSGLWLLFDALNVYSGDVLPTGTGCSPSPGLINQCDTSVAVEAESFGSVKVHYQRR